MTFIASDFPRLDRRWHIGCVPPSDTLPAVAASGTGAGFGERTEVLGIGVREKVPLRRPMLLLRACNRTQGRRGRSGTSLRAKTAERGAERCHPFYFHEAAFSASSELFFDNHGGFPRA